MEGKMIVSWYDDLTNRTCTPEDPGAFVLKEEELPFDGAVIRRVMLTLKPGEPPRSLRICYSLEHVPGKGVRCWNSGFKLVDVYIEAATHGPSARPGPHPTEPH